MCLAPVAHITLNHRVTEMHTVLLFAKHLAVCTLGAIIFVSCSGPQKTTSRMPDGASDAGAPIGTNGIVVQTDASAESTYKTVARVLQRNGYSLSNTDSELQTITTDFRSVNPPGLVEAIYEVKLSAGIVSTSPTQLRLTGQMETDQLGSSVVKKTGQDGSPIPQCVGRPIYSRL